MPRNLTLFCILAVLVTSPVFAQDTSVNVNTITAPELPLVPVIDGDLSDAAWANIPVTTVNGSGDDPAPKTPGDLDFTMKAAWDKETNAVYFAITIVDDVFVNVEGQGSTVGNSGWHNERLEFIINAQNTGQASHGESSQFHTQYIFDLPNTLADAPNGLVGIPVSTTFTKVPVFEGIDGSIQVPQYPFNLSDDFIESAAMIRTTDPAATAWAESPVEFTWEIKLVLHEELYSASEFGYDLNDPVGLEEGFKEFFNDIGNVIKVLKEGDVIGISPQQNDTDVYATPATRQHQVNTTNVAGNWDSSAQLTGLILGPTASTHIMDWSVMD